MKNKNYNKVILLSLTLFISLIISCSIAEKNNTGSLSLNLNYQVPEEKLSIPEVNMAIDHYELTLTGPDDETMSLESLTATMTIDNLIAGEWSVAAKAINSDDLPLGTGNNSIEIIPMQTSNCAVIVLPFEGYGGIYLSVTWDTEIIETASILGELNPAMNTIDPIDFSITNGSNIYENSALVAGYYILTVNLTDNDVKYGGAIDVVRILADEITNTAVYVDASDPHGSTEITIIPEMNNPIDISLSGGNETMTQGTTFTITADASVTENVTYTWYINGTQMESGPAASSYTIPNDLTTGIYRLDITIFTNDGLRGGSDSFVFEVI